MIHGNLQHAHVCGGMAHFEFIAFAFNLFTFEDKRNDWFILPFHNFKVLKFMTSANKVTCFKKVFDFDLASHSLISKSGSFRVKTVKIPLGSQI